MVVFHDRKPLADILLPPCSLRRKRNLELELELIELSRSILKSHCFKSGKIYHHLHSIEMVDILIIYLTKYRNGGFRDPFRVSDRSLTNILEELIFR